MNRIPKAFRMGFIAFVLVGLSIGLSGYASKNFEIARHLDIFTSLFRELVVNYVDDVNPAELMQTGINEMLYSLDPYTNFIPESQIEDVRFMTTGQYGGIGALIHRRESHVYISEPYEGFPAHKAGLLAGDKILEINGQEVLGLDEDQVRNLLQGQPGTTVSLLIEREGEHAPMLRELQRQVVTIDNIPHYGMVDERTAYIKLTGFTQHAGREVREAINELHKSNTPEQIILDLRGNGGGLLNEAVNITNLFVEKNELIVSTKGRMEERNSVHRTLNEPLDPEIPLVVLVDRRSASASEIVAGAIQDLDRGVIIGERTFGKGLVQNVVPLSYNTQLKVTIAKYYIPSGRCIQAINYAERNEDGSVAMIPDSLKMPFATRNGRTVYDGGGIEPDLEVGAGSLGQVTIALLNQFQIFDYANYFHRQHPSIPPPGEFEITDAIYADFVAFLDRRDFDYITESERRLESLRNAAREELYFESIAGDFEQLKTQLLHNKDEDLRTFRPEISRFLKEEIATRFYFQKGRVLASLSSDPEVEEAIRLFAENARYQTILAGK
ncbi:MAG: S41 family peptidase [Bacteroidales bacterium]